MAAAAAKNNKRRTITIVCPKGTVTEEQYRQMAEAAHRIACLADPDRSKPIRQRTHVEVDVQVDTTEWNRQLLEEHGWQDDSGRYPVLKSVK